MSPFPHRVDMRLSESMRTLRTETEQMVGKNIERIFIACPESFEIKLENFPKYVRRQHLKRFLALYEIFKLILPVKGSIIECGVFHGFGLMSWAKLSTILEPENLTRRVYGFDSFGGFPSVHPKEFNTLYRECPKAPLLLSMSLIIQFGPVKPLLFSKRWGSTS